MDCSLGGTYDINREATLPFRKYLVTWAVRARMKLEEAVTCA